MAHYSGKQLYVSFKGTAISGDHRGMDVASGVKIEDTTAGADVAESHIVLTTNATIDLTILDLDGAPGQAIRTLLVEGATGELLYGPEGNAATKPKFGCQATVTSVNKGYPYDGAVELKVTFTRNGDWTFNHDKNPAHVF